MQGRIRNISLLFFHRSAVNALRIHFGVQDSLCRIPLHHLRVPLSFCASFKFLPCPIAESPSISATSGNQIITVGDDVMISCNASGVPAPTLTWHKYTETGDIIGMCDHPLKISFHVIQHCYTSLFLARSRCVRMEI